MRKPQFTLRELMLLVLVAALGMTIALLLRDAPSRGKPTSTIFEKFDPVQLQGALKGSTFTAGRSSNTFNPVQSWGWRQWNGTIDGPAGIDLRSAFCAALEAHLQRQCQNNVRTYWRNDLPQATTGQPFYAEFAFNQGIWHGEMFVWLVPDSVGNKLSYATILWERPVK